MEDVDRYIQAATRANTRKAYRAAVRDFEVDWGGFLPATADSIARYLVDRATQQSLNTLKQRLAGLAQWHVDQGFPDPTKAPHVRKVLKGIRELHPAQEKRARPLQLEQLATLVQWLESQLSSAPADSPQQLRLLRDRALVLLGFWRGFRSDELCRLQVEHITITPGQGIELYLPRSKGDRAAQGMTYRAPALQHLCPVEACQQWLNVSGLTQGALFRKLDRWGHIAEQGLHINSILPLLRDLFLRAGLSLPDTYSSHSLRRGFATWAYGAGWDVKALMEYVGWKDLKSALRYVEIGNSFELALPAPVIDRETTGLSHAGRSEQTQWQDAVVDLHLNIESYHAKASNRKKARDHIERACLKTHGMRCLNRNEGRYRLAIHCESPVHLDRIVRDLLTEMQQIADSHHCFIEAQCLEPATGRNWD
ncbi:MAG: site-specific integrase [Pseudomonadota bacterium]